jgi:hypothetical protein
VEYKVHAGNVLRHGNAKGLKVVHFKDTKSVSDNILALLTNLEKRLQGGGGGFGNSGEPERKKPRSLRIGAFYVGGPRRGRTGDQKIKSLLLYQLS